MQHMEEKNLQPMPYGTVGWPLRYGRNPKSTSLEGTQRDFIKVYWKLREKASNIDWNVFEILVWSIWNNRNLLKHEGTCKADKTIVRDAKRYVEEFRQGTTSSNHTP